MRRVFQVAGSPEINKVIRRCLSPVLRQHGFARVQTRHNWGWHSSCTWVLDVRAVGNHFEAVTGWPSMSVGVWLGVFYDFVPLGFSGAVKLSPDGRPLPQEFECQQRSHLDIGLVQRQHTVQLQSPAEQSRTDIWWIKPNGGNVEDVMEDIAQQFLSQGLPWFERMTDIPSVYAEIENERDCFDKFSRATYIAKYLEREEEYQDYRSKMEREAHQLGRANWLSRYP